MIPAVFCHMPRFVLTWILHRTCSLSNISVSFLLFISTYFLPLNVACTRSCTSARNFSLSSTCIICVRTLSVLAHASCLVFSLSFFPVFAVPFLPVFDLASWAVLLPTYSPYFLPLVPWRSHLLFQYYVHPFSSYTLYFCMPRPLSTPLPLEGAPAFLVCSSSVFSYSSSLIFISTSSPH